MRQTRTNYVIIHGRFARPAGSELLEVAALQVGGRRGDGYRTAVRCNAPEIPEEQNLKAPAAAEVFAHMNKAFGLRRATVVMWAGTAYKFHVYAGEKQLENPFAQTRIVDLQAAVVLFYDLKTSDCKSPHHVVRLLNLTQEPDCWSQGSLPFARAMNAVMIKLLESGWTPESTPAAVLDGPELGAEAEERRVDRWEQIRERQNNLGVERRPVPESAPAFILVDIEHASVRFERFSHLIEVALVVAHRKERQGRVIYEATGQFSSLVQFQAAGDTTAHAWEITGIKPEEVRTAPPLDKVMADVAAVAPWDQGVLVTWGPDDARVITQNCVKAGIPSPVMELPLIDLQRAFSRFYAIGQQQVSLQNAAAFLEIDTSDLDLHRALADTQVTWRVLERMLDDGWTPLWRASQRRQAEAGIGG